MLHKTHEHFPRTHEAGKEIQERLEHIINDEDNEGMSIQTLAKQIKTALKQASKNAIQSTTIC